MEAGATGAKGAGMPGPSTNKNVYVASSERRSTSSSSLIVPGTIGGEFPGGGPTGDCARLWRGGVVGAAVGSAAKRGAAVATPHAGLRRNVIGAGAAAAALATPC